MVIVNYCWLLHATGYCRVHIIALRCILFAGLVIHVIQWSCMKDKLYTMEVMHLRTLIMRMTFISGMDLKSDQRVRVLSGGRQLQISSAERTDTASYTCTASSAAGSTSKEYSLQVYGKSASFHIFCNYWLLQKKEDVLWYSVVHRL